MKKLFNYVMILFIIMFVGIVDVKAFSISLSQESISANGGTIKVTFSDLTGNSGYIYIVEGTYKANVQATNNGCGSGSHIEISSKSCTITYNIKKHTLQEDGNVIFKLKDEATGEEKTKTLTVVKNSSPATTTAQVQTTTAANAKSNNANLKTLEVKTSDENLVEITPKFDPSVYQYKAEVSSETKTVIVNVTMEDEKSNVIINGADEELKSGEDNKITITVTAEDGTKKQYVLNVSRGAKSADATIASLKIKQLKDFKLEEGKYKYTVTIPKSVTKLDIIVTTSNENATYEIKGNNNLKAGSNIKIIVTAEDGTKKEYILTVSNSKASKKLINVKAEKNPLVVLLLSLTGFALIGGIIYTIRKKNA